MKKYIKYSDNGKDINGIYSDETVVKILRQHEAQHKNHEQMAVMFGIDFDRKNVNILNIVFFNDRPVDNDAFTVHIADFDSSADKKECAEFGSHIEQLLISTFPEKYLYSQKEQMQVLMKRLFSDVEEPFSTGLNYKKSKKSHTASVKESISSILSELGIDETSEIDYRKEKVIDSYSPVSEVHDLPYNKNILLLELKNNIEYLGEHLESIKVSVQSGGFSEEYDEYLYSIIIQMNQLHKNEYCEIDIREFLEKHDGIEKIRQTTQYIGNVISKEWPRINVFIDCTITRND